MPYGILCTYGIRADLVVFSCGSGSRERFPHLTNLGYYRYASSEICCNTCLRLIRHVVPSSSIRELRLVASMVAQSQRWSTYSCVLCNGPDCKRNSRHFFILVCRNMSTRGLPLYTLYQVYLCLPLPVRPTHRTAFCCSFFSVFFASSCTLTACCTLCRTLRYVSCLLRAAVDFLSLIHISEPTRLGMISYAVFCL